MLNHCKINAFLLLYTSKNLPKFSPKTYRAGFPSYKSTITKLETFILHATIIIYRNQMESHLWFWAGTELVEEYLRSKNCNAEIDILDASMGMLYVASKKPIRLRYEICFNLW